MITKRSINKYMEILPELAKEAETDPEVVERVLKEVEKHIENNRRQPKPPAPEGGICLREAERRYRIGNRTLSEWAKHGYIPIILRTKNELYVDEARLAQIIKGYNSLPGGARRTIKKVIPVL